MNHYHIWFDLKPGVNDLEFARTTARFMDGLKAQGLIEGWRMTRRKLGFGPQEIGDFHVVMQNKDMAQLDAAFGHVAARREPVESAHFAVNAHVRNWKVALYRDFPDEFRHEGEEKF